MCVCVSLPFVVLSSAAGFGERRFCWVGWEYGNRVGGYSILGMNRLEIDYGIGEGGGDNSRFWSRL